ncbi:ATP-binding protein [Coprococcus catus]
MDIKRAKQEIKDAIEAYLVKDECGKYMIPAIHQRPILLMGPPGIGKTQIMEQVARECGIGLVAYTITHHTRQSAVGLPFIQKKQYGGKEYSVTEYTMSEIIASVYDKMEVTGHKEGILFIDEINCVSETLAPTMLQFLQCKTFGNQKVPEGWIIVAAGNPPEYNKSVREFDVVTLDRIKKIDVEENFDVWKEYAYQVSVHPAVISYLDARRENFYRMETTVDGRMFATARGWEDLSRLIQVYERLGKKVDREVVHQYIQHWKIAKDFANYLELYVKYRKDYGIEKILEGTYGEDTLEKLKVAAFDEKLSVVNLLSGRLAGAFKDTYEMDRYVSALYEWLKKYRALIREVEKEGMSEELYASGGIIKTIFFQAKKAFEDQKKAEKLDRDGERCMAKVVDTLERYWNFAKEEHLAGNEAFEQIRELFADETEKREEMVDHTMEMLEHAFEFLEKAFGESQEMVVFVTELNTNYYSIWFLKENDCGLYYKYNKGLLFDERHQEILKQMDEAEESMERGIR